MIKKLKFTLAALPIVFFLGACESEETANSSSMRSEEIRSSQTYESTEESTVISEMTEVEINAFDAKLDVIQSNVEHYESTQQVGDPEVLYATLQEVYEYNLTPEQEEMITQLVSKLPGEFIDYQTGLAVSKHQE